MKKLFIRDLELRFSFSPIPGVTNAKDEAGKPITTLRVGEEGRSPKDINVGPRPQSRPPIFIKK